MPEENAEREDTEFGELLAIFMRLANAIKHNNGQWNTLEELMAARANIAIQHALDGFGLTLDEAIQLIDKHDDLSNEERVSRDIVIAAIDNLVDFAVAEEYQMAEDLPDIEELDGDDLEEGEIDEDELAMMLAVFTKYNKQYAKVENLDIEYAMMVAAFYSRVANDSMLTYWTQGDNRVRPWHRQYEGFSAPKSRFPAWLIPPIEYNCRCFLVEDTISVINQIQASRIPDMPDWFNPVFKESVAQGGRIFSDAHPYFQIEEQHLETLADIAYNIKSKYHLNGSNTN